MFVRMLYIMRYFENGSLYTHVPRMHLHYLKSPNTAIPYGLIINREWSINTSYTGKFGFSKLL